MLKRLVLAFILGFLLCPYTTAQSPQSVTPQAQASSTTHPSPFGAAIKKAVGLLRVVYLRGNVQILSEGTCFFVIYEDKRLGENGGFMYLVTNRHVASPGIEDGTPYQVLETHLRLNLRDSGQGSEEGALPIGNQLRWFFPSDDSIDLAVLPLLPDQTKYDYIGIPTSIFATQGVVASQEISEGDRILFTGFFYQFPGLRKFQPIVREGTLAMLPDEKMETTLRKPGRLYLADVHVFGGNSGSPLLVNLGGFRNGNLQVGNSYRLLGIISGYYHEDSNLNLTVASTLTGTVEANSGIALVVPVDDLKSLLDSPALQAQRDAEVAAKKAAN